MTKVERRDGARMSSHWKSDVAEQEQLATRGQCGDIVLSKPETSTLYILIFNWIQLVGRKINCYPFCRPLLKSTVHYNVGRVFCESSFRFFATQLDVLIIPRDRKSVV